MKVFSAEPTIDFERIVVAGGQNLSEFVLTLRDGALFESSVVGVDETQIW